MSVCEQRAGLACQDRSFLVLYMGSRESPPMDRQAVLAKIAAMLKLQEASNFEGESAAAAAMIDKLCAKYGVTVDEATTPQVLTEDFYKTKRMNNADFYLFCGVARFYDAKGIVHYDRSNGRVVNTFRCIGTEAQQIQVKLYYEFLKSVMDRECEKAYQGEKILAELLGNNFTRAGFKTNFNKAFVEKIRDRLVELKADRGPHEHKEVTAIEVSKYKIGTREMGYVSGWGAQLGSNAGSQVSLNKQAGGSQRLALTGG
jgi:hypothetical protein